MHFLIFGFIFIASSLSWSLGSPRPPDLCEEAQLLVNEGDLVFVEIGNPIFQNVSKTQNHWANHVGIAFKNGLGDWYVAESTIPRSKETNLCKFLRKAGKRNAAILRYQEELTSYEIESLKIESKMLMNIPYHTGFKLNSNKQFCSKFVDEVYFNALGVQVGETKTFRQLLHETENPESIHFWRLWFGGFIPWQRVTLTPASQYLDPKFNIIKEWVH